MKNFNSLRLSVFGLAVALVASGCHHQPNLTPMPGSEPPSANNPGGPGNGNGGLSPGNPVPPEPPPTSIPNPNPANSSGYPASANGLWNRPHTEDSQKFAADTVYFDFDSSTIKKSEESKLEEIAAFLKDNPGDALRVEGNCDERGTEKYNLALGDRRALASREYLANLGIDPMRIQTITYGASKPIDPAHNEDAWKKNRRDDFVLLIPQSQ